MKKLSRLSFAAILIAASASAATAATITVGVDQPTVAAAVTAAVAGDTIIVPAGTHTGSTVTINKNNLTIQGPNVTKDPNGSLQSDGSRPVSTERLAEARLQFGFTIANGTQNTTISGLLFENMGTAVTVNTNTVTATGPLTFKYNIVQNNASFGILRSGSGIVTDHTIEYNRFTDWTNVETTALWYAGSQRNDNLRVRYNYISNGNRVYGSRGMIVGGAYNALVEYNTIHKLGRYAAQFADAANAGPLGESPITIFRYNTISNVNAGVQVLSTSLANGATATEGADISNNTFTDLLPISADIDGNPAGIGSVFAILFTAQSTGSAGSGVFDNVQVYNNTISQNVGLVIAPSTMINVQLDPGSTETHGSIEVFRNNISITGTYNNADLDPTAPGVATPVAVTLEKAAAAGSGLILVNHTGHGFSTGRQVVAAGGIVASNGTLGTFTITVIDANSYTLDGTGVYNAFASAAGAVQAFAPAVHGIRIAGEATDVDLIANSVVYDTTNESTATVPSTGIFVDNSVPTFGNIPGTATINVQDNVVDGAETGIRLEAAPNTVITGNTLSNNGTGLDLTNEVTDSPDVTGNNFVGNDVAVNNNGGSGIDADGNFWGAAGDPAPGQVTGTSPVNPSDNSPFPLVPVDTDGDGLSDYEETNVYATLVNNPDSDADGINDGIEVSSGSNPNDNTSPGGSLADTDNDLIPDTLEAILGLDATNPDENNDRILDGYALALTGSINGAVTLGDANSDGLRTVADAIAILEAFLGVTEQSVAVNRDINRDGQVNNLDAVILHQWVLQNIDYIPFP